MTSDYILIFARALEQAFQDMLGVDLVAGEVREIGDEPIRADVSASMTLKADSQHALVILTFDADAAVDASQLMTGERNTVDHPLVADTVREFLNITVGSAQRISAARFQFSLPISVQGKNHEVSGFKHGRSVCISMQWESSRHVKIFLNLQSN
ncbi:MAG: chemotaxis protein CheX [Spirochaetia bacterium]|nr:chemotaxis protein CheX [Spirochaetia bacterium]